MISEKPKLLIFDVNETLLDLSPLKSRINEALHSEYAFDIWFRTLLHYSLVETVTENYEDFSTIGKTTMQMVCKRYEVDIVDSEITSILGIIKKLPPHDDVVEALIMLKASNFKLVALSNGNDKVLKKQLRFAAIDRLFDAILSVESVREYKPKASAYEYALREMRTSANHTMMIAAHGWDILGAKRAGLKTAFVERKGKLIYTLGGDADLMGKTILEIANKLVVI